MHAGHADRYQLVIRQLSDYEPTQLNSHLAWPANCQEPRESWAMSGLSWQVCLGKSASNGLLVSDGLAFPSDVFAGDTVRGFCEETRAVPKARSVVQFRKYLKLF